MYRKLDGLSKRCGCAQGRWDLCHQKGHPWYHHVKPEGTKKVFREVLGVMTRKDAKKKQEERRTALQAQVNVGEQSDGRMLVDDVAKLFAVGRPRNAYLNVLCRLELPRGDGSTVRFGSKRIKDVSVSDLLAAVEAYKTTAKKRAAEGKVGVRKLLQTARHMWNWALDTDKTNRSPFYKNGRPSRVLAPFLSHKSKRNRRLQDGEEARLLKYADPYTGDLIVAILDTGLRGGSLRSLQWQDVQGTHLVVPPAKQKRGTTR